jgi:hypothetical protein
MVSFYHPVDFFLTELLRPFNRIKRSVGNINGKRGPKIPRYIVIKISVLHVPKSIGRDIGKPKHEYFDMISYSFFFASYSSISDTLSSRGLLFAVSI